MLVKKCRTKKLPKKPLKTLLLRNDKIEVLVKEVLQEKAARKTVKICQQKKTVS